MQTETQENIPDLRVVLEHLEILFSSSVGLGLSNVLEAKIRNKDSTKIEPKKIKILNNLNFQPVII